MSNPYTDAELERAARAVLDNFNAPDDRHPTWWINPKVSARAVLDAVAPAIAARALREAAAAIRRQDSHCSVKRTCHFHDAAILNGRADEIEAGR